MSLSFLNQSYTVIFNKRTKSTTFLLQILHDVTHDFATSKLLTKYSNRVNISKCRLADLALLGTHPNSFSKQTRILSG